MAIEWGAWEGASPTRIRVGIDVSWETITHGEAAATATIKIYTDVEGNWSDSQTLNFGGSIGGSVTFTNNQSNNQVLRETKSYTYNYGANEYGSSPGSRTFSANLTGAFNGATPSKSVTKNIPARPYDTPAAPTGVSISRISDTSHKISWTNKDTAGEPWDLVRVQYDGAANDIWNGDVGTPGGGSTSFTDSGNTGANASYKYRVRAENSVGNSAWVETAVVHTTPAAPSSPSRSGTTTQSLSWANNVNATIPYNTEVWRAVNGVWALLATVGSGVTTYSDTTASVNDKVKYKFRAKTTGGAQGTLYSTYSAETTETAGVTSAPNAPTLLSPSGILVNPTQSRVFSWQHNPTDGSSQQAYEIQWRVQGGAFNPIVSGTTATSHTFAANTFPDSSTIEWQVRTRGANASFGAWSAIASFTTVSDPNQARKDKRAVWLDIETGERVTAPEGSLAPIGAITEFAGAAAPPGWLMCQGQVLAQSSYPDLFGVIGTTFNTGGETASQFRLPDLTGRVPLGAGVGIDGVTRARGARGGQMTLSAGNLPPHTHDAGTLSAASGGAHKHDMDQSTGDGTAPNVRRGNSTVSYTGDGMFAGNTGSHTHTVTGSTGNGPGATTAFLPPYVGLNFIIKV